MRARLLAVLSTGALAAGVLAVAPPAGAAPSERGVESRSTTAAERAQARAYWTPARMAAAVPGGARVEAMAKPSGQKKPGGGGSDGGSSPLADVPATASPTPQATVGKVFFTLKGTNYVCSASVVSSANDSTVLTAGHCLHEGRGGSRGFASNFLFVPGYDDGPESQAKEPYGRYAATGLHTTSQWANSGDFVYDVGFAVVERTVADVEDEVGGFGVDFTRNALGTATTSWGYPAAGDYDGRTLETCGGRTVADPYGSDTQGIPCNLTGGSSGGPWLVKDTLFAHSVNSYKYTSGPYAHTHMYGPYFGSAAKAVYDTAAR